MLRVCGANKYSGLKKPSHCFGSAVVYAEALEVLPKQRVIRLDSTQSSNMVKLAAKGPPERWPLIKNNVEKLKPCDILGNFGIDVDLKPVTV